MKNILVVTWYYSENYGTCLQCYALVEYLRSKGYNVTVIDSFRYYYGLSHPIETVFNIGRKILRKIDNVFSRSKAICISKTRLNKNYEFAISNIKVTVIKNRKDYENVIQRTDVFVTGSDQIWNPNNMTPPMLLAMAPNKAIRVSYGSSLGVSSIPIYLKKYYKMKLNRFTSISVREKTGKEILENLVDKEVSVVLDPTLLIDTKVWEELTVNDNSLVNKKVTKPFVFCYFLRKNVPLTDIHKFCEMKGLVPVFFLSENNQFIEDEDYVMIDAGVKEFVESILKADYIFTDSFHATALSINFNKKFYVYKRFDDNDSRSQNSRLYDLLEMFDVKKAIVNEVEGIVNYDFWDYKKINIILKEERIKSEQYIFDAVESV